MPESIDNRAFVVGDKPYCVWYAKGTTEAFLRGIDTKYFLYLADVHSKNLEGENKEKAIIALRTAYHQGLETFFMLLFATLQAPNSVVGWLLKCETQQLHKFVRGISKGELPFVWKWKIKTVSWDGISELINGQLFADCDDCAKTKDYFAQVWEKLASDYVEPYFGNEYNSFKHGFRASVGTGPTLTFSSSNPEEKPPLVLSSEYGTWFNVVKDLERVGLGSHLDHHFVLEHCHLNSDPKATASALCMISMSIHNIVAFLKVFNRFPIEEIQVMHPANEETFQNFLKPPEKLGLGYVAMALNINKEAVSLTKQQILERLTDLKKKNES
ncbi:MAG TPA: hypothetical protein VFV23_08290 [Verrucomicrobiae bacterium]|nr:hypothetical protein [Verrucomicrobiae bacterium]